MIGPRPLTVTRPACATHRVRGVKITFYMLHVNLQFFYSKMISPIFILHQFLHLPKNQVIRYKTFKFLIFS